VIVLTGALWIRDLGRAAITPWGDIAEAWWAFLEVPLVPLIRRFSDTLSGTFLQISPKSKKSLTS